VDPRLRFDDALRPAALHPSATSLPTPTTTTGASPTPTTTTETSPTPTALPSVTASPTPTATPGPTSISPEPTTSPSPAPSSPAAAGSPGPASHPPAARTTAPPGAVVGSGAAQTIDGFGASGAWWPDDLVHYSPQARQQVASMLFGSQGIALSIYRYNIGGGGVGNVNRASPML
jgi:hypothetical protein